MNKDKSFVECVNLCMKSGRKDKQRKIRIYLRWLEQQMITGLVGALQQKKWVCLIQRGKWYGKRFLRKIWRVQRWLKILFEVVIKTRRLTLIRIPLAPVNSVRVKVMVKFSDCLSLNEKKKIGLSKILRWGIKLGLDLSVLSIWQSRKTQARKWPLKCWKLNACKR